MNLLLDELPEYLDIGGMQHKIRSDFRTWIRFENTLFWDDSPWEDRIAKGLYLCYGENVPFDFMSAFRAAIGFYNCNGSERNEAALPQGDKESKSAGGQNHSYSFQYDAGLIYAAFRAQYGVNLVTANLHWWEFNAMFSGLTEGNKICKIMEYRMMDLSAVKDKEMKAYYRRMKRVYRLPDPRSEEEMEAAMIDVLAGAF